MSILNYKQVRGKWQNNFFMYHGVSKVVHYFGRDSLEVKLLENLLLDFTKHKRMNNKYSLMGGVDYDLYENKLQKRAMTLMSKLNRPDKTDFKISYKDYNVYVELK